MKIRETWVIYYISDGLSDANKKIFESTVYRNFNFRPFCIFAARLLKIEINKNGQKIIFFKIQKHIIACLVLFLNTFGPLKTYFLFVIIMKSHLSPAIYRNFNPLGKLRYQDSAAKFFSSTITILDEYLCKAGSPNPRLSWGHLRLDQKKAKRICAKNHKIS